MMLGLPAPQREQQRAVAVMTAMLVDDPVAALAEIAEIREDATALAGFGMAVATIAFGYAKQAERRGCDVAEVLRRAALRVAAVGKP